jgi:hypothetical protein
MRIAHLRHLESNPCRGYGFRGSCGACHRAALGADPLARPGMTAEKKFSFGFNLIWVVQSLTQKYSSSLLSQITSIHFAIPAHTKGRFAIVTDVGSGCDAADGEVVWS